MQYFGSPKEEDRIFLKDVLNPNDERATGMEMYRANWEEKYKGIDKQIFICCLFSAWLRFLPDLWNNMPKIYFTKISDRDSSPYDE